MGTCPEDTRYAFRVQWRDTQAELLRDYELIYNLHDGTLQMTDLRTNKKFLKRTLVPSGVVACYRKRALLRYCRRARACRSFSLVFRAIFESIESRRVCSCNLYVFLARAVVTLKDLYIGNTITVYSRQLKVIAFADAFTKQKLGAMQDSTVVVCPPTAYENLGKILDCVFAAKFKVANLKMFRLPRRMVENIFQNERWGNHIIDDLAADAFVAFEVMTVDPIDKVQSLIVPSRADSFVAFERMTTDPVDKAHALIDSNPALFAGTVSSSNAQLADQQILSLFGTANLPNSAQFSDCTVCVIKPHAVTKADIGVAGQIIDAILSAGFDISAMEQRHLDPQDSAEFLEVYKTVVPEYSKMSSELSSGPCIALEVRGEDIVNKFREFCGPHSVEVARALYPSSLRARFGIDRIMNAVHCTDLEEDGVLENQFYLIYKISSFVNHLQSQYFFSILSE